MLSVKYHSYIINIAVNIIISKVPFRVADYIRLSAEHRVGITLEYGVLVLPADIFFPACSLLVSILLLAEHFGIL